YVSTVRSHLSTLFRYTTLFRSYMDLSVMHDNAQAIALYEKLGFRRVHFFGVKRKNPINEALFVGPTDDHALNPYARIIIDEARRDRKSTRLNSSHVKISYADFC